jgi:hypothetical protein
MKHKIVIEIPPYYIDTLPQGIPRYLKIPQDTPRYPKIPQDTPRYLKISQYTSRNPNIPQILPITPRYFQLHPDTSRYLQTPQDASIDSSRYLDMVSRCTYGNIHINLFYYLYLYGGSNSNVLVRRSEVFTHAEGKTLATLLPCAHRRYISRNAYHITSFAINMSPWKLGGKPAYTTTATIARKICTYRRVPSIPQVPIITFLVLIWPIGTFIQKAKYATTVPYCAPRPGTNENCTLVQTKNVPRYILKMYPPRPVQTKNVPGRGTNLKPPENYTQARPGTNK